MDENIYGYQNVDSINLEKKWIVSGNSRKFSNFAPPHPSHSPTFIPFWLGDRCHKNKLRTKPEIHCTNMKMSVSQNYLVLTKKSVGHLNIRHRSS